MSDPGTCAGRNTAGMHSPRTLVDGTSVDSWSNAWRCECLARHLLGMPLQERRAWLADFEQRHGPASTERLETTIAALQGRTQEARSKHLCRSGHAQAGEGSAPHAQGEVKS